MAQSIKACPLCQGNCFLETHDGNQKTYSIVCTVCGNETDLKSSKAAAIRLHNQTTILSFKNLFTGAPDA